ncbi:MAG: cytochrome P450 [Proteobacteria bacterium]|nr:MAG: cytochrome P450 [Pseudomonadota bacterium]
MSAIPRLSGGVPLLGHLLELRRDPIALMQRCRDECGEVGELRLAGQPLVMLYGEAAQEAFFRAPDEQLDQAAAYPFMKPVFGPGVVFDATPEQRKQALRNRSLRDQALRGHAETIARETERMIAGWGDAGAIDLLDFFAELTIYTSSAALVGPEFREELGPELVPLFQDLERGTDAIAYVNPNLPLPSFRKRDAARRQLVAYLQRIFERRERSGSQAKDLFAVLRGIRNPDGTPRYDVDTITGMFISLMFAGHHTTSTTSSWALLELLRHPEWMRRVTDELDALYADDRDVSYQALREIPVLESCFKETLRLHPPLVLLMRKVAQPFSFRGWTVPVGKTVGVSIAVSNRDPAVFRDPARFDPTRYEPGREEDRHLFAWIPFGAGRHRCVGAAFAMMQVKAIFSILLRRYEFELAQPPASYREDHSKMVVQLAQPCRVRYQRRARPAVAAAISLEAARVAEIRSARVAVDLDLCQGHAVCVGECPEVFQIDPATKLVRIADPAPAEVLRPRVDAAIRHCPTKALRWTED